MHRDDDPLIDALGHSADELIDAAEVWRHGFDLNAARSSYPARADAFIKEFGEENAISLFETLDGLQMLLLNCAPEERNGMSLGEEASLAKARFQEIVPGIPSEVMSKLSSLYHFQNR
ncbi:hypothetical protein [Roseovarius sp. ZX-A-9]|uniref:hypothetical protein n=1 Tax=Roseovarius sp. ZX-A-9 TaxID=3014783 RepID=UPI00232EFEDE|nr:hypothetical protein [Roseovarius sp. ZX-A-9]